MFRFISCFSSGKAFCYSDLIQEAKYTCKMFIDFNEDSFKSPPIRLQRLSFTYALVQAQSICPFLPR